MKLKASLLKLFGVAGIVALVVTACGGGGDERLALRFSGLEPLANGYHYEGRAIIDGPPITTGKFNIGANGLIVDLNGRASRTASSIPAWICPTPRPSS